MPETTPFVKVSSTKAFGGQVVLHGRCRAVMKMCVLSSVSTGYTFVRLYMCTILTHLACLRLARIIVQ